MLKILEASDKISGRSAYSRVSDQLLKRLAVIKDGDKPRYEVAHIPMGKAFNMGKWITRENITIYPSGNTPFAEDVMVEHYVDFGADILITLKEPWVFHSIYKMAVNFVPNAIIDHSPVSPYITNALHTTFKTIAVSRFGQRELKQAGIDNVEYIPHGVDSKVFRPLEEHKKDCKKMWYLDDDDFTVLLVARNQARKQIPHQMRIYQRFREMNPDVKSHLYLWTEARPSTELTEDTVTPLGQADLGVNLMPEMMALGIMQSVRFPEETDLIKKGLDDWVGDVYGPDQKSYDMVKLYNCLPPYEKIITREGMKNISSISLGDEVLTHKGRYRKVLKLFKKEYDGKLVRIRVGQMGYVDLTPEHPVLALRPKFARHRIKNMWRGFMRQNRYRKRNTKKQSYMPTWVKAGDLKKNDVLIFPKYTEKIDDQMLTNDMLEFYGIFAGDGWTSNNRFGIASDNTNAEYIGKLFEKVTGFGPHIDRSRKDYTGFYKDNKILAEKYREMFGKSSREKHVPPSFLDLPLEKQKGLLKGLWLSDGHVTKSGLRIFVTISDKLADQVRQLLIRQNIVPSMSYNLPQGKGKQMIWRIAYKYNDKHLRYYTDAEYTYLPIREIKQIDYNGEVYNMEVEEDNSYTTKAFVVHNCADVLLGCTGGEGFFLPGIEAQLCGIPEVVTDYAAQPETLGAGYLIPWTTNDNRPDYDVSNSAGVRYVKANIDRAAEALTKVMNGDRAKISKRARQFALRYDWDRVINEHVVPFLDLCEAELRPKITREGLSKWTQT